jgi:hypothetical protein
MCYIETEKNAIKHPKKFLCVFGRHPYPCRKEEGFYARLDSIRPLS